MKTTIYSVYINDQLNSGGYCLNWIDIDNARRILDER
jgi:hypothetical protein